MAWVDGRWTGPLSVRGFPEEPIDLSKYPEVECPKCKLRYLHSISVNEITCKCPWCSETFDLEKGRIDDEYRTIFQSEAKVFAPSAGIRTDE